MALCRRVSVLALSYVVLFSMVISFSLVHGAALSAVGQVEVASVRTAVEESVSLSPEATPLASPEEVVESTVEENAMDSMGASSIDSSGASTTPNESNDVERVSYIVQVVERCDEGCQAGVQKALFEDEKTSSCVVNGAVSIGSLHQVFIDCDGGDGPVSTMGIENGIDGAVSASGVSVVSVDMDGVVSV